LAKKHEYINEAGLAYELAAKFYLSKGRKVSARAYMQEACYCYQLWGATAKVKDLERRYPHLLTATGTGIQDTKNTTRLTTTGSRYSLDIATVVKASQAISGEIVLDRLLSSLMNILIENAGAQKGYLILASQGELLIEAEGSIDGDRITVLQSIPIDNRVPSAILNYVVRTQESVVLNDAASEGQFTNDPYIKEHQSKSILCVPLINQGQLISIVYLENNLTAGAFTPEHLEVVKILSSQAAISIENAQLYQTLEDKVKQRTAQLAQANEEISDLNDKLKAENIRLSAELEVTKRLQQMILPKQSEVDAIEGLEIAGFMEPADEVGGDYYDVLQHDGKVKISIGDVTGHGLESGVVMLMTQTAVRTLQES
ncbi:MAG TPA: GAF domain-containing protein, partial [Phormidium sp.]